MQRYEVQHKQLSQLFPDLTSLEEFLKNQGYNNLLSRDDPLHYRLLLETTLITASKYTSLAFRDFIVENPPPPFFDGKIDQSSQSQVISRVIETLVSCSPNRLSNHVLALGYRKITIHSAQPAVQHMEGVENYYPNTNINFVQNDTWEMLLGRIGEKMMIWMLLYTIMYVPVRTISGISNMKSEEERMTFCRIKGNFVQISGISMQSVVQYVSSHSQAEKSKVEPKKKKEKKKRVDPSVPASTGFITQASAVVHTTEPVKKRHLNQKERKKLKKQKNGPTVQVPNLITQEKLPEEEKPKVVGISSPDDLFRFPANIVIQRFHHLYGNTYNCFSHPQKSDLNGLRKNNDEDARLLLQRIFNRQPQFNSDVQPEYVTTDHQVREEVRGVNRGYGNRLERLESILKRTISRYQRCRSLLHYHCPIEKKAIESLNKGHNSHYQVWKFIRSVLKKIIPPEMWGSPSNFNQFMNNIFRLIKMRRYESFTLEEALRNFKISECKWSHCEETLNEMGRPIVPLQECLIRMGLVHRWIYWVVTHAVCPTLRTFFYATEHSNTRFRILYYRKSLWAVLRRNSFDHLKSHVLTRIPNTYRYVTKATAIELMKKRGFGHSYVRILPKNHGIRPIVNFRRKPTLKEKTEIFEMNPNYVDNRVLSINSISQNAFYVIKNEKDKERQVWGDSVFGQNDVYKRIVPFINNLRNFALRTGTEPNLYICSMDITRSFDSIRQDKLFDIIEHEILKDDDYLIVKYATSTLNHDNTSWKVKWNKAVTHPTDFPQFYELVEQFQSNKEGVLTDQVIYPIEQKQDILNTIRELIFHNIVKDGESYYVQKVGIPQGSILSPLLCSLFYAHLEKSHLSDKIALNTLTIDMPHRGCTPMSQSCGNDPIRSDPQKTLLSPMKNWLKSGIESQNTPDYYSPDLPSSDCGLLMRFIDDSIYITTCKDSAVQFVEMYERGFPAYGAMANPTKTKTSFPMCDREAQGCIREGSDEFIPWYGLLINTKSLEIQCNYYSFGRDHRQPGRSLYQKMVRSLNCRCHPLLLDSNINSFFTVYLNVYQMFLFCAIKFVCYASALNQPPNNNPNFFTKLIRNVIDHLHQVTIMSCTHSRTAIELMCNCSLMEQETTWLGLKAFTTIMQKKSTKFRLILKVLRRWIASERYKLVAHKLQNIVKPEYHTVFNTYDY
ncbi:telomerase reverse transcriptase [Planoprotostelium fungivorum]|uniref:Telomerase reverse transcriptase n=1 Tax=Planoprotostelium fungivorum TaxID=1890364 RepID=A0A2P6P0L2_9EUKA|nr:telomerase reverse transcriptase [Planoprotostelium fungivorum]